MVHGYRERRRHEHDRDMVLAWHVAALSRTKRMPSIRRLLTRKKGQPPQGPRRTSDEIKARIAEIEAQFADFDRKDEHDNEADTEQREEAVSGNGAR